MNKKIFVLFAAVVLSLIFAVAAVAQTSDKKLKILKKPMPESGDCSQSSGLAMVRVTFDKSGKVTDAVVTKSSGCASFDNNSIAAARKIKFEPQTKDGEPVTVTKPVEYKYYRY